MPSVRKRPNGTYEIRFFDSKRVPNTVSFYVSADKDAELIVSQKILAYKTGSFDPWKESDQRQDITLARGWELFKKKEAPERWSDKTLDTWSRPIDALIAKYGSRPCSWLTTKSGKDAISGWRWPGVSVTTQDIYARGTNSFLSWLHSEGYLTASVKVEPPDLPDKAVSFFLEPEFYKILEWFKSEGYGWAELPLMIGFYLGMRRNEVAYLVAGAVRLEAGLIHVGYRFKTKTSADRFLPIPERIRPLLASAIDGKKPFERVFDYNPDHMTHLFKKAARAVLPGREDIHLHSLRHSCAVYYLSRGSTLYEVSKLLGHKSYRVTEQNYASLDIDALRRMVR